MSQATHHYLIFETAGGFCGIAWNDAGITRFQLPTQSAEATERLLRRSCRTQSPARRRRRWPTPSPPCSAISRASRTDFSDFSSTSASRTRFFKQIYAAARRVGWGQHHHLWRAGEGTGRRARGRARCRPGHGQESGGADHPLPPGPGGRRQGRWLFRAGRRDVEDPHAGAGRHPPRPAAIQRSSRWSCRLSPHAQYRQSCSSGLAHRAKLPVEALAHLPQWADPAQVQDIADGNPFPAL